MFWWLSVSWLAIYLLAMSGVWTEMIKESPITFFHFLGGLPVLYALSGINVIKEWKRRPVLLFGKYVRTAGPGLVWIDPIFHTRLDDVPVQDVVEDMKVENVQTHDNVRLNLGGVRTTRIYPDEVKKCVVDVKDVNDALAKRATAAMVETVGLNTVDFILGQRKEFSERVKVALQEKVLGWGIEVKAVEITDFKIADELIEQAIAMKARAEKEAQGDLKRAEMQLKIAQELKKAASTFDESTWRLKGLETLVELCRSANNNTILIPASLSDVFSNVIGTKGSVPAAATPAALLAGSAADASSA